MPIDLAKRALEVGNEYPYDAPDNWDGERELPAVDWAHKAARGILYDLGDRGGIKHGFVDIEQEVRVDIVEALAAIIRAAHCAHGESHE